MKARYKHSFDRIMFQSRWARPFWNRTDAWLILGVYKRWFGHLEYEYEISFFGFAVRIWMKREFIEQKKE